MFASLFASSNENRSNSDGVLGRMKTSVGRMFGGDDEKPKAMPAAKPAPTPKVAARPSPAAVAVAHPKQQQQQQQQQEQQQETARAPAETAARQSAASGSSLMSGAAPTVPAGSFDTRWGAMR